MMEGYLRYERPNVYEARMVLGFTGWMDGGRVSTGTIELLAKALGARKFGEIDSAEFYIHNFPVATLPVTIISEGERTVVRSVNPMEQAAVFRPRTEIRDGVVRRLTFARNDLMCAEEERLVLFTGEEPHIRWRTYAECLLTAAEECDVREIIFVGSVAGPIPHTREPRLHCGVSTEELRDTRRRPDLHYTSYEGPASFVTFLMVLAAQRDIPARSLVVDVPHYPFLEMAAYPASILRVLSVLQEWLELEVPVPELARADEAVREQLDQIMEDNEDFRELVHKLEQAYDAEATTVDDQLLRRLLDQLDLGADPQGN